MSPKDKKCKLVDIGLRDPCIILTYRFIFCSFLFYVCNLDLIVDELMHALVRPQDAPKQLHHYSIQTMDKAR